MIIHYLREFTVANGERILFRINKVSFAFPILEETSAFGVKHA